MLFPWLGSTRAISPSKQPSAHKSTTLPLPITTGNLEANATTSVSELSSLHNSSLPDNRHLNWGAKLLQRRKAKSATSNLALGPSGAIVFKGHQSRDSLVSTSTADVGSTVSLARPKNLITSHSSPSLRLKKRKSIGQLRSHSQDSLRSVAASNLRRRSYENNQPRLPNFLGRHPPPIQGRSSSIPLTPLLEISENAGNRTSTRELLLIGDDTANPIFGYIKVPRLAPQHIKRDEYEMVRRCGHCDRHIEGEDLCPECLSLYGSEVVNVSGSESENLGSLTRNTTAPSKFRGFLDMIGAFFRNLKPKKG